jgi:predicted transcriptional regulator
MFLLNLIPTNICREITYENTWGNPNNPFKTYYSDPSQITQMVLYPEKSMIYLGFPYGLICKNLTTQKYHVITHFDGLNPGDIDVMELDKKNERLFIIQGGDFIFVLDLNNLTIVNKINIDIVEENLHGFRFEDMFYENESNKLYLGSDPGLAVLNLNTNEYNFYDYTFFNINLTKYNLTDDATPFRIAQSFDLHDIVYNPKTSDLYIATSEGLTSFNTIKQKFTNYRDDSKLSDYYKELVFNEKDNKLFIAGKKVVEFDLTTKFISEFENPEIINQNFLIHTMSYDSKNKILYALIDLGNESHRLVTYDVQSQKYLKEIDLEPLPGVYGDVSTEHIEFDYIQNIMYFGVGSIERITRASYYWRVSDYKLYTHDFKTNKTTPIIITNQINFNQWTNKIKIHPKSGKILISNREYLYIFNPDKTINKILEMEPQDYIADFEIQNNFVYLASKNNFKIFNLTNGNLWNISDINLTKCQVLKFGQTSGNLYIGTDNGLVIYNSHTNKSQIYPLNKEERYVEINGIAIDEDAEIVYLAYEEELYCFDLVSERYELKENTSLYGQVELHYKTKKLIVNKNPSNFTEAFEGFNKTGSINTIYIDQAENKLYLVTGSFPTGGAALGGRNSYNGLLIYDFENKTFEEYTWDHGIPTIHLTGMTFDSLRQIIYITGEGFFSSIKIADLKEDITKIEVFNTTLKPAEPGLPKEPKETKKVTQVNSLIYIGLSTICVITITGFLIVIEPYKYKLIAAFATPYYSRLKKDKVLDHNTRGQIQGYIQSEPGAHYNELKKNLELNNGALSYHLQVLEREGYIKSLNIGRYKHFFPRNMRLPKTFFKLNEVQKVIFKRLTEDPGISQSKLSDKIGSSISTVNYNIKVLEEKGIVEIKKDGNKSKCYIIQENGDLAKTD